MKKRGRPPVDRPRASRVTIRFAATERESIEQAASAAGQSVSEYVRGRSLEGKMEIIGSLYVYDNGQSRVVFKGRGRDWYVWSERQQSRLATYRTRRELAAAFERSSNSDGAYGCARLRLGDDEQPE